MVSDDELGEMLARATDGRDHEWGWYADDVPRLIAEIKVLRAEVDRDRHEFDDGFGSKYCRAVGHGVWPEDECLKVRDHPDHRTASAILYVEEDEPASR